MAAARVTKALSERICLISANQPEQTKWVFSLRGQTLNVYDQTFSSEECTCSCPDYQKRKTFCKHLLYIICRIGLQMEIGAKVSANKSNWNKARFDACSQSWALRLKHRVSGAATAATLVERERETNEDCSICFDRLTDDRTHQIQCQTTCKNWFHADCMGKWLESASAKTCPMCRSAWKMERVNEGGEGGDECKIAGEILTPAVAAMTMDDVPAAAIATTPLTTPLPKQLIPDILFTFDTTGSMYPCLSEVKRHISEMAKKLFREIPHLRIAVMAHGDYCDRRSTYLTKHIDFTSDANAIVTFISTVESTGGGDYPEAYEYVLQESRKLSWRIDSTSKSVVMIGDAPPHEPHENPDKIDWRQEAERLRDRNIQVYSVQCLNSGNRDAFEFYSKVAEITNGYHLFLDQFSYIKDMIEAICYRQYDVEQLEEFERQVQSRSGGMTGAMRLMFDTMLGRKTRDEITRENRPETFHARYRGSAHAAGRATTAHTTSATPTTDGVEDLRPVPPTKFQVLTVDRDVGIADFCHAMGIRFHKGKGFYEFTKPEIIQPQKEIVLMKRSNGDLFEGDVARRIAGIPRNDERAKIRPGSLAEYRVFIQSTSANRKLINGQGFLYEVSYE